MLLFEVTTKVNLFKIIHILYFVCVLLWLALSRFAVLSFGVRNRSHVNFKIKSIGMCAVNLSEI